MGVLQSAIKQLHMHWPSSLLLTPILDFPGTGDTSSANAEKVLDVLSEFGTRNRLVVLLYREDKTTFQALNDSGILTRLREGGGPQILFCMNVEKQQHGGHLTLNDVIKRLLGDPSATETTEESSDEDTDEEDEETSGKAGAAGKRITDPATEDEELMKHSLQEFWEGVDPSFSKGEFQQLIKSDKLQFVAICPHSGTV
mmetsp:Transcript_29098/g.57010  ORF Transcript_29098/g.57010 Transcript_29098/m.57010 type:complete len:199 (+) Transcript_29098:616-1212(+)